MPTVPAYQPTVRDRPILQQGVDVRASADDMGAAVGRGMQGLAAGVSDMGDAIAQVRALEDEAAVRAARNEYIAQSDVLKYDPDRGFLQKEGKAAIDAYPDYRREVGNLRRNVVSSSKLTPTQQRMFARAVEPLEADASRQGMIHKGNALKKYITDDLASSVETFANQAILNANDPALVQKYIAAGQLELRRQGELTGWGADTRALREGQFVSGVHRNITQRIAQDDPLAAEAYMEQNAGQMTGADQFALRNSLEAPVLAAKGERNAAAIIGGVPAQDIEAPARASEIERRPLPPVDGPVAFNDVASKMLGLSERADGGVISDFIKRSAGISIDPKVTPWCAAFVNGVLGASGVGGNGSLSARSFMNFGKPVDTPRMGDIVVLSRGSDPSKGHVGFFQGFDANGNIVVLGGNQGNKVSVATYGRDRLVGFRRAGPVNENTARLPNYSPAGLSDIQARLAAITDPKERKATQEALSAYYTVQKKAMDAEKDQAQSWAETQVMQNPTFDPMKMPLEVQTVIGASGMTTLLNFQEKVRSSGQPVTDDRTFHDLQTLYAQDPAAFADVDLFQYRDKLDNSSWKEVNGWRQTALTDERKAREDGMTLTTAFSQASSQLEALGITTTGTEGSKRQAQAERIAQFNNALSRQMQEFKAAENRNPTQVDIQTMINRLLLPVVMSDTVKRSFFDPLKYPGDQYGTSTREGFLFEGELRTDLESVDVAVEYADVPTDMRRVIAFDLQRELGRKPDEDEIVTRYEDFVMQREPTPIPVNPVKTRERSAVEVLFAPVTVPLYYGMKLFGVGDHLDEEADAPEDAQ